jgi:hypothetical protein
MKARLTLSLDERLVRRAKAHARRSGKTVSQIVADYFPLLGAPSRAKGEDFTPTVRALKGVLRDRRVGEASYRKHVRQEHLKGCLLATEGSRIRRQTSHERDRCRLYRRDALAGRRLHALPSARLVDTEMRHDIRPLLRHTDPGR